MAQVGRISGPLLKDDLLRNGKDLAFRNTVDTTQLLYLDVNNNRIGVNTGTPTNELHNVGTLRTIDLITGCSTIAGFNICNGNIEAIGNIELNASEAVIFPTLENGTLRFNDNVISSIISSSDIDIDPNGTGSTNINSNLNVEGNLAATGNITLDGTINFGDTGDDSTQLTDTVTFETEVDSDIIPNQSNTYNLGSSQKRWNEIFTNLINGKAVNATELTVGAIDFTLRQGNIFYVSQNGTDSNKGDHPQSPVASIRRALDLADASAGGPVVIYVNAGDYEEETPLVVPSNVTIIGTEMRIVNVFPTSYTQSEDVFHLNGETTIQNITVKDFYFDDNKGYAFRFAPNAVISTRSPYVQNCTVITKGSNVTAEDPRGFDSGDAGRGAYVDGAELDSNSVDASMLFHSVTFITPGADGLTMTNGVRVEWLNSFTYFANRGLYAFNNSTGRVQQDGSTVSYGAELRSIGSANVYGNYGAVADGDDTLMYLIQHNFGYIGTGKNSENDKGLAIQANEVVEENSGKIYYVTTDHNGNFRVGDNFVVDFETGGTSISLDDLSADSLNGIIVTTATDTTVIRGSRIDTGNIRISDNNVETLSGDLIIDSPSDINLQNNTNISQDLSISGDLSFDGSLNLLGNQTTDTIVLNVDFDQDFSPNQTLAFNLGSPTKEWLIAHLTSLEVGDISIYNNVVETNTSNADLEIRANGTGNISIPQSATFSSNLQVNGSSTFESVIFNGELTLSNNLNLFGSALTSIDLSVTENINIGASAQFEEIKFDDNFITTTTSNTDLELRASGNGTILIPNNNLIVTNNTNVQGNTSTGDIINSQLIEAVSFTNNTIEIYNNIIETSTSNSDLDLRASAAGNISVPANNVAIANDLDVDGVTSLDNTNINGTLTHNGNRTQSYTTLANVTDSATLTGTDEVAGSSNFYVTNTDYFWENTDIVPGLVLHVGNDITIGLNRYIMFTFDDGQRVILEIDVYTSPFPGPSGVARYEINDVVVLENPTTIATQSGPLDVIYYKGRTAQVFTSADLRNAEFTLNGELTVDNVYVEDNFITTTTGDLTLGATGDINVDVNDVEIAQDLTVSGATSLQGTTITGTVTHAGDRTQIGNLDVAGEISNGNILIEDNFISTTNSNSDLELGASGTGEVVIDPSDAVTINNNLFVGGVLTYNGALTINGNVLLQGNLQDGSLTVTDNFDINGLLNVDSQAQFEEILIEDNFITTTSSNTDLELRASGTGEVVVEENLQINNNLTANNLNVGDITIAQDLVLDTIDIPPSIIEINDNYISTKVSNADLDLRANGTGKILISNNDVSVVNVSIDGTTDLQTTNITGDVTQTGDLNIARETSIVSTNNLTTDTLSIGTTAQLEEILIEDNNITTTSSNADLELAASGSGSVVFENSVFTNNLQANQVSTENITVDDSIDLEILQVNTDIQIFDNVITTTDSNSNLELRSQGTGRTYLENLGIENNTLTSRHGDSTQPSIEFTAPNVIVDSTGAINLPTGTNSENTNTASSIRYNSEDSVFEGYATSNITFGGVYSADRQTSVTADPTSNTIRFVVNGSVEDSTNLIGQVYDNVLELNQLQVDDVNINSNVVKTTVSNSDLELVSNGTGEFTVGNFSIKDNELKNNSTPLIFRNTDFGYSKIQSNITVPSGTDAERPIDNPEVGDTRFNETSRVLEIWDGTEYVSAAGASSGVSESEFNDLLLEYTIILG